nr:methyltransferase domain-containing protein [Okeania sp. SIO2C9]
MVASAQIKPGDKVLDIATGTCHIAIEVAQLVGNNGRVVGIDISSGILEQARKKVAQLNLTNIEFQLADGENIDFPANSFDLIFCANAFPLMAEKAATLRLCLSFSNLVVA